MSVCGFRRMATRVTDMALGEALDKLVLLGTESSSKDGGACLTRAVRKAGMPEEALTHIVKADSDKLRVLGRILFN